MVDIDGKVGRRFTRALVTGGAGFIGSHLVEKLLNLGLEVVSVDDFSAGREANIRHLYRYAGFKSITADVTEIDMIRPHFKDVDVVFHQACSKNTVCMENPARDLRVNAHGTLNVLTCSKEAGVKKIVHASTGSVYGEPVLFPTNEDHPLQPVSYYGVSKLAGEKYAMLFHTLHGMDLTVLRYFHVYGPRQENSDVGGVVSIFCRRAQEGRNLTIFGDGSQVRSFTHVSDIIRINLMSTLRSEMSGGVYNCASGVSISIQELAEKILEFYGKPGFGIEYGPWKPGDIKKFHVDNSRIRNLGFEFEKDFNEGLQETLDWTRQFIAKRDEMKKFCSSDEAVSLHHAT